MQPRPINDKYVLCPFQIQLCDRQGGIALGTAFFYQMEDDTFIITNWHNVTGRHPLTGEPLHPERSPLYIQAKWPVVHELGDGQKAVRLELQTIEIEDTQGPLWFEHRAGDVCLGLTAVVPPQNLSGGLGVPGVVVVYLNGHLGPQSIWISNRASQRANPHSASLPIRIGLSRYSGATNSPSHRTLSTLGLVARKNLSSAVHSSQPTLSANAR